MATSRCSLPRASQTHPQAGGPGTTRALDSLEIIFTVARIGATYTRPARRSTRTSRRRVRRTGLARPPVSKPSPTRSPWRPPPEAATKKPRLTRQRRDCESRTPAPHPWRAHSSSGCATCSCHTGQVRRACERPTVTGVVESRRAEPAAMTRKPRCRQPPVETPWADRVSSGLPQP